MVGVQSLHGNESPLRALSVLCGIAHLTETTQNKLSSLGFCIDPGASMKLVLDFPSAYGFSILEELKDNQTQLIVVTWNPCQEYMEDLWDLEPDALLAGETLQKQNLVLALSEVMDRISNHEPYRLTPGPPTVLTQRERLALRYVARGWQNKRIARWIYVEEQTVKNLLRAVYRKLGVRNHVEAALYYWGMSGQFKPSLHARLYQAFGS